MEVTFKGVKITKSAVLNTLSAFDSQYPNTNDYENWLDKDTYTYAIQVGDRLYPPKHILSQVSGIDTTEFTGGHQTNSVFKELGFKIIDKP